MNEQQQYFRTLMGRFVTGVTVIAVPTVDGVAAMTANAVAAVSLEPLLLLCCVRNESRLLPLLLDEKRFSVNVLAADQTAVSKYYGGRKNISSPATWHSDGDRVPRLKGALASFICTIHATYVAGDHTVVYGRVQNMHATEPASEALVFAAGRFSNLSLASRPKVENGSSSEAQIRSWQYQ